ncbi:MAG: hypothetical protein PVG53_12255 [Holophagae bacterium]|jgi:hypothetical protein
MMVRSGVVAALMLAAAGASALETDQYWAWNRPLADSTEAVNARFNLELERTLAELPGDLPAPICREVAAAYRSRMRFLLLHEIQNWAWNSRWVARIPDGAEAQRDYTHGNLYSNHPLFDPATWMPFTPTISVAGVRFGTDKLAHFVSSGWTYYAEFHRRLANGRPVAEAERGAVERGLLEESLILGRLSAGVLSVADLEASHAGMQMYRDLCDTDDAILALEDGRWTVARPLDLRDYVTPRWDESYQPPIYGKRRWRKVRPVLEGYCDRLDDPRVIAERRRYRELDRRSSVDELVAEKVAAGDLADPDGFGLEAVCGAKIRQVGAVPADPSPAPAMPADGSSLVEAIAADDADRRRFALGLAGLHLSYPQVVSASLAVMATSQPASYDCRTPCNFRGPFAELEPGLGGIRFSVGWARIGGSTGRRGAFLRAAYIGLAYKLTVLRTWGDDGWVPGNRTFAGVELGVPVAQANVGLGLLARVDGGEGRRWTITGSLGWGF